MKELPSRPGADDLGSGRALYQEHCAVCHGKDGRGDGPAAAGTDPPPANFLDLDHSAMYGPGEKFWIIGHGLPAMKMPSFDQLTEKQRWDLVAYILSLQGKIDRQ